MLIDSHVNLHHARFAEDREAVIARARAAGVEAMVTICDEIGNFPPVRAIAQAHADIFASVGAHPHHARAHRDLTAETLIALAQDPNVVGIGETGLDLHYGFSPIEDQIAVFRVHIAAARATGLPLIVHTRKADDLTADILETAPTPSILMHCYTSGEDLARRALALGASFSFSGILTFKNAEDVRAIARMIPLDRVILETDCPYLAPAPHRGQRCEPAHVAEVYRCFAELRGLSMDACARIVAENFHRIFSRIPAKVRA